MFIRKIKVFEKDIIDLHKIEIIYPSDFEKFEKRDNYMCRLHFVFTDGYHTGFVFPKTTTRRDTINALRKLANEIEEQDFKGD